VPVAEAFQTLPSDRARRPLYPQVEPRREAHLWVAFLGAGLTVTLRLQRRA
jgi:hypothetical protein